MNEFIKGYLDRSHEIIGERTPEEVAHDNEVIKQLRKGRNIKKALKMAAQKYPAGRRRKGDVANINNICQDRPCQDKRDWMPPACCIM